MIKQTQIPLYILNSQANKLERQGKVKEAKEVREEIKRRLALAKKVWR